MKEIRLSAGEAWQKQHWKSLHSAYSNSAFFEHYADELETIYRKPATWLADWNQMCMEWISTKTGFPPELKFVTDPGELEPGSIGGDDPANDLRKKLLPKNYASFPAPVYNQVFENINGFQANLSVLDLLFNTGPAAGLILQGNKDSKKNGLQF